jgi:hypothetical protein
LNGQLALPLYCGLKTGPKLCPENDHLNTGLLRWWLYY